MFKGFATAIAIVTAFLVVLPALMLWAHGGADWLERLDQMSPFL